MNSHDSGVDAVADEPTLNIIYDNTAAVEGPAAAWGFSCLIGTSTSNILFDCGGDGAVLSRNVKKLKVDLDSVRTIFLSHEHWDHVGGLDKVLAANSDLRVIMLHSFTNQRKSGARACGAGVVEVSGPRQVYPGIYSTGEMGMDIKEQALVLRSPEGLVIITGCAHPGIVEIVRRAIDLFGSPVRLVLGGFHLLQTSREDIAIVSEKLQSLGVQYVAPCHCTGGVAMALLQADFGEHYLQVGAGSVIDLGELK